MTREEIERARELLEIHRRTSHMSCTVERGELVGLVMNHVEELLSLAEEARWRKSDEEEPPQHEWLIGLRDPEGLCLFRVPGGNESVPILWRRDRYCAQAFQVGLRRGLELAKGYAELVCDGSAGGGECSPGAHIDFTAADAAVDKECG